MLLINPKMTIECLDPAYGFGRVDVPEQWWKIIIAFIYDANNGCRQEFLQFFACQAFADPGYGLLGLFVDALGGLIQVENTLGLAPAGESVLGKLDDQAA